MGRSTSHVERQLLSTPDRDSDETVRKRRTICPRYEILENVGSVHSIYGTKGRDLGFLGESEHLHEPRAILRGMGSCMRGSRPVSLNPFPQVWAHSLTRGQKEKGRRDLPSWTRSTCWTCRKAQAQTRTISPADPRRFITGYPRG